MLGPGNTFGFPFLNVDMVTSAVWKVQDHPALNSRAESINIMEANRTRITESVFILIC